MDYVYNVQDECSNFEVNTEGVNGVSDESDEEDMRYYKMTFVVNTSLNMGVGKIAAQVWLEIINLPFMIIFILRWGMPA